MVVGPMVLGVCCAGATLAGWLELQHVVGGGLRLFCAGSALGAQLVWAKGPECTEMAFSDWLLCLDPAPTHTLKVEGNTGNWCSLVPLIMEGGLAVLLFDRCSRVSKSIFFTYSLVAL